MPVCREVSDTNPRAVPVGVGWGGAVSADPGVDQRDGAVVPALGIEPVPTSFGRRRYRTGLVARRSAEDLAPMRAFEAMVRDAAREGPR